MGLIFQETPIVDFVPCIIRRADHNRHDCSVFSHLLGSHVVVLSSRIGSAATSLIITRLLCLRNRSPRGSVRLCVGDPKNSVSTNVTVCSAVRCVGYSISAVYINLTTDVNDFLLTTNAGNGHLILPGDRIVVRRPLKNTGNRTSSVGVRTRRVLFVHNQVGHLLSRVANRPLRIVRQSARHSG